ncbi:unnamed protein product [Vitrella brassicaformis CCMP3155]|uniref:Uncharacterized protein n=1 Tax=Vitrella brassicaformis (strain CCMP3155) TaxID=1169540 RepID=A0A0G4GME7_VITBC|nr:unnamed protein product [Vitrella brassicaformis CCMP3155]|eukprot:CEM31369.1 unnamed protein product [Vitrella brassicaformis CCMP3155]
MELSLFSLGPTASLRILLLLSTSHSSAAAFHGSPSANVTARGTAPKASEGPVRGCETAGLYGFDMPWKVRGDQLRQSGLMVMEENWTGDVESSLINGPSWLLGVLAPAKRAAPGWFTQGDFIAFYNDDPEQKPEHFRFLKCDEPVASKPTRYPPSYMKASKESDYLLEFASWDPCRREQYDYWLGMEELYSSGQLEGLPYWGVCYWASGRSDTANRDLGPCHCCEMILSACLECLSCFRRPSPPKQGTFNTRRDSCIRRKHIDPRTKRPFPSDWSCQLCGDFKPNQPGCFSLAEKLREKLPPAAPSLPDEMGFVKEISCQHMIEEDRIMCSIHTFRPMQLLTVQQWRNTSDAGTNETSSHSSFLDREAYKDSSAKRQVSHGDLSAFQPEGEGKYITVATRPDAARKLRYELRLKFSEFHEDECDPASSDTPSHIHLRLVLQDEWGWSESAEETIPMSDAAKDKDKKQPSFSAINEAMLQSTAAHIYARREL